MNIVNVMKKRRAVKVAAFLAFEVLIFVIAMYFATNLEQYITYI